MSLNQHHTRESEVLEIDIVSFIGVGFLGLLGDPFLSNDAKEGILILEFN